MNIYIADDCGVVATKPASQHAAHDLLSAERGITVRPTLLLTNVSLGLCSCNGQVMLLFNFSILEAIMFMLT